eukprot:m.80185 g.80185  ORF g.80185 m.80185 type:complete len:434 (+) comp9332_c0_seq2:227-1528(+)
MDPIGDNDAPPSDEKVKEVVNAKMKRLRDMAEKSAKDLGLHFENFGVYKLSMSKCMLMGSAEYDDGNQQRAFQLYFRAAVIYLEVMSKHPGMNNPKNAAVKKEAEQLCLTAMSKIESLKEILKDRFTKEVYAAYDAAQKDKANRQAAAANVPEIDRLEARLRALEASRARRKNTVVTTAWSTPAIPPSPGMHAPPSPYASSFPSAPSAPSTTTSYSVPPTTTSMPAPSAPSYGTSTTSLYPSLDNLADFDVQPKEGLSPDGFRWMHVPSRLMAHFRDLAKENSANNRETCGILAGKLKGGALYIEALVIPPQSGEADSCSVEDDIPAFMYMEAHGYMALGWIHTHPSQTAFLSSVDLHTSCQYQAMLHEAIAVVCSIKYADDQIFRLTTPTGMQVVSSCQQRGFHVHEDTNLFQKCTHVKMDPNAPLEIKDFR